MDWISILVVALATHSAGVRELRGPVAWEYGAKMCRLLVGEAVSVRGYRVERLTAERIKIETWSTGAVYYVEATARMAGEAVQFGAQCQAEWGSPNIAYLTGLKLKGPLTVLPD